MATIKCGNCKRTHISVSDVRRCYEITANEERMQAEAEYDAEMAVERYYENRGWAEAQAFEQWEQRNGARDYWAAKAEAENHWRSTILNGVRSYAGKAENYNAGWDVFIECYSDDELMAELERLGGLGYQMYDDGLVSVAINALKPLVEVHQDRKRDIEATAF